MPVRGSCQQWQTYGEVSRDMGVIGLEQAGKENDLWEVGHCFAWQATRPICAHQLP